MGCKEKKKRKDKEKEKEKEVEGSPASRLILRPISAAAKPTNPAPNFRQFVPPADRPQSPSSPNCHQQDRPAQPAVVARDRLEAM
jgi:hypothetical protein